MATSILPEEVIKLLLAVLVGGLIGIEREINHKTAGLRTMILICVGATLFTIFSIEFGHDTRIVANIVVGVGFIGAGVILHEAHQVTGLTTASTIWLTAALGMGIGGGFYLLIVVAVGVMMLILAEFPWLERRIAIVWQVQTYELVCPISQSKLEQLDHLFKECGLRTDRRKQIKRAGDMICTWRASGPSKCHDSLVQAFFADPDVKEFDF